MEDIITVNDLNFAYSKKKILDNLSLHVPNRSIYGFLGPNGAGKTTTIRLLLGLIPNKENNIQLFDKSLKENRIPILEKTGALVEMPSLYPHLSGFQNLELTRKLIGGIAAAKTNELLDIVRLTKDAHTSVKKYSLGMKQRLGLAIALLNNPELLILDEPTNGLDPAGIKEIRELIVELHRNHGKTIFLSSHLLNEIEKMATHVGVLKAGKCVFEGELKQMKQLLQQNVVSFKVDSLAKAEQIFTAESVSVLKITPETNTMSVQLDADDSIAKINKLMVENNISVFRITAETTNLESLFIELTEQSPI